MLRVTAAIICSPQGRILFAQRKDSDKYIPNFWEFPGGKVNPGESLEDCLAREIQEEFNLAISDIKSFMEVVHEYPELQLRLHAFLAKSPTEIVECTQHKNYKWLEKEKAQNLNFAPADIPIFEKLLITNWP